MQNVHENLTVVNRGPVRIRSDKHVFRKGKFEKRAKSAGKGQARESLTRSE